MIRRPPRSTQSRSSAASDVYKRQTFPHNPSLEYDLLVKNTLHQARAQVKANAENTGFDSQIPYLWGTAEDKFGNANEGWDDYGPYYTPQIAQYYGSMGQTVETPYKTCLLYTSDAADELLCVDLGGRRIIKKKKK